MDSSLLERAKAFLRAQRKKSIWYRTMCGLAAVVVFVTTYMLILPAITMERDTICGKTEHKHTDECYETITIDPPKVLSCTKDTLEVHKHTDTCYDSDHNLICGYADFVIHTHDENCYDEDGKLVCTLPEIKEHRHTASCYQEEKKLICTKEESEGHKHTADCYKKEKDSLQCTKEEHTHDEKCYDENGNLVCTKEEHIHDDSCYTWKDVLICKEQESEGHKHTDACYETVKTLICDKQEAYPHTHSDACYKDGKLVCGQLETKEHQHTADCWKADGEAVTEKKLICDKEEHEHSEECYKKETEGVTAEAGTEGTSIESTAETSIGSVKKSKANWAANNSVSAYEENGSESSSEETTSSTRSDLSNYIGTDTNFTSATYNPEKNQVEASFHMTFAMDKAAIQSANYQFTYNLPKDLTIPDDMLKDTYEGRDTSGEKGFTYKFVKNSDGTYSVLVDFVKDYVDKQDNFSGYIDFNAIAGEDARQEGGDYKFKFSDYVTVTIPVSQIEQKADESISYNVDISKTNSGYDAKNKKITYTITVDTSKGTPDPLNLTDILTAQGLEVDKVEIGSVTCIDYTNEWGTTDSNTQKTLDKGTNADQYTFTYDSTDGITMILPGLKEGNYKYGQKYTITYDVYLKEPAAGASYTVDNKVTVTGTDSSKGETVTDNAETSTTIDKSLDFQKYGTYDKSTNKIKWTITVNQNGNNIAGATLTDDMFKDLGSAQVTVSPDSGYTLSGDTITFSGMDSENSTNTQAYIITYETDAPEVGDDGTATVSNKATVTPPGGGTSKDVTAEVKIDKNLKMVKTGTYDKATDTITWTIIVNENGNDIAGAELTDDMFSKITGDITVSPNQNGMTIVKDEDAGTIQKITFSGVDGDTNTQTYTITYTTPSGIAADDSGTVTNNATLDSKPGVDGGEITSNPGVWVDRKVGLDKSNAWYDSTNNQLHWSISVNNNKNNIVGYTLTDDMFGQIVDGTLVIKIGYDSVDLSSGANGFTIEKDTDGKITSIIFTKYDETGANTNHYTIEYCTEAKPGWDSVTLTNTATLTLPGGTPITDTGTGTIPADGSVYKKWQGATALVPSQEDSNVTITWRTEINVPAGGLPANTVVTDTLADGQWMDWIQIQKWGSVLFAKQGSDTYTPDINYWWPQGETYDITFYDKEGKSYTYADIVGNNGVQGKQFVKYEITFPNGVPAENYGGKTIYFEYESYADVSSVTDSATYRNTVSVTPPDGTSKSSEASYTYKAPGVVKMDGDGNTGTTNIVTTNGELTWKVRVRLGADCTTLTVTDTLPEGVTLTGLIFANQALTIGTDGSITGTLEGLTISEDSKVTIDESANKQTLNLTVTVPKDGTTPDYLKANGEFYVVYTCKISDELLEKAQASDDHKVGTFINNVTVTADSVDFPKSSQTQEVTYTKPTSGLDLVNKGGVWNNDARLLEYSMLLNPDGMDLLPNSDTLTLTDVLSYYIGDASMKFDVALLPGSVNLYKAVQNDDGTWKRGDLVTDWSWSVSTHTEYTTQFYSTITATIPDGTPLILEYAYNVWVPDGSSFDNGSSTYYGMYNKATLTGVSGGYDETKFNVKWEESHTSAGITADRAYIFYKVEENSYGNRLPGAEFTLYNETGNALFTYITDDNGSFTIQWQSNPVKNGEYEFDHNTLYYVQETKAPEGYLLPDNPTKYYFYFSDATDTGHTLDTSMLPENAVDLSVTAYTAYVENVKNTTEISVEKKWQDKKGNKIVPVSGEVTLKLYQKVGNGSSSGGSGGTVILDGVITDKNGNTWKNIQTVTQPVGTKVTFGLVRHWYDESSGNPSIKLNNISLDATDTKEEEVLDQYNNKSIDKTYYYTFVLNENVTIKGMIGDWSSANWELIEPIFEEIPSSDLDSDDTDATENEPLETVTIHASDNWQYTFKNLPVSSTTEDGTTIYYTYYVQEDPVPNYTNIDGSTEGVTSGTITITNKADENPSYTLPETGGPGTRIAYTLGSILMMFASAAFLYIKKKRMGKKGGLK